MREYFDKKNVSHQNFMKSGVRIDQVHIVTLNISVKCQSCMERFDAYVVYLLSNCVNTAAANEKLYKKAMKRSKFILW